MNRRVGWLALVCAVACASNARTPPPDRGSTSPPSRTDDRPSATALDPKTHERCKSRGSGGAARTRVETDMPGCKDIVLGERFRLAVDERARHRDLVITLAGYGHKITHDGDEPFVELELAEVDETTTMRAFTPIADPVEHAWRGWIVTVLSTENAGPPHDPKATTELMLTRRAP